MAATNPAASLYAMGHIMSKIPGILQGVANLLSFRYWKRDARQFREAREEWKAAAASIRLLLAEIDEIFESADGTPRHIHGQLSEIKMATRESRQIASKLDICSRRLARIREDA